MVRELKEVKVVSTNSGIGGKGFGGNENKLLLRENARTIPGYTGKRTDLF